MTKFSHFTWVCIALATVAVNQGDAGVCCSCYDNMGVRCADNTPCTPCCGYQSCNIICCNCGECRKGIATAVDDETGFKEIDLNGDGFVDREEAHAHIKSGRCGNYSEKIDSLDHAFKLLDTDGDGKLTIVEINSPV